MKNVSDFNGLAIDYRSLTPIERAAFRDEVIAWAHHERAEMIRSGFRMLAKGLDRVVEAALQALFTPKVPTPPSRRCQKISHRPCE